MRARKFYRVDDDGGHEPIRVSMRHQVFVVAADAEHADVEADAQRLGPMTEFYRRVYSQDDPYRVWHYTVLDTGLGASYPGHGAIRRISTHGRARGIRTKNGNHACSGGDPTSMHRRGGC